MRAESRSEASVLVRSWPASPPRPEPARRDRGAGARWGCSRRPAPGRSSCRAGHDVRSLSGTVPSLSTKVAHE
eukprot:scaffold1650_cov351-Prasinococcus_capsulatus_cf.AAC.11